MVPLPVQGTKAIAKRQLTPLVYNVVFQLHERSSYQLLGVLGCPNQGIGKGKLSRSPLVPDFFAKVRVVVHAERIELNPSFS